MKKNTFISFVTMFLGLVCCAPKEKRIAVSPLDGYWILTDAVDSTLQKKAIEPYLQMPNNIAIGCILLHIKGDSAKSAGTIDGIFDKIVPKQTKNFLKASIFDKSYTFSYNPVNQQIEAQGQDKKHIFRRVAVREKPLIDSLQKRGMFFYAMNGYFYDFFLKGFITGTYKAINTQQEVQEFTLYENGKVEGFKTFTGFGFDNYFGTRHPYVQDALSFVDDSVRLERNMGKSESYGQQHQTYVEKKWSVYAFIFKGDTLLLNKLETKDQGMQYNIIGKEKYRFVRQR